MTQSSFRWILLVLVAHSFRSTDSFMARSVSHPARAFANKVSLAAEGPPFNFGPVSSRDSTLYTAERPGNPPGKNDPVDMEVVNAWLAFMKEQGVTNVVSLLDDNEFGNYPEPGLLKMYEEAGFGYINQPMREEGASKNIFDFIKSVEEKDEKVVTHCTGGIGRAGRVAAGWLVEKYGLSPTDATEETLAEASKTSLNRKGDPAALEEWLG